MGLSVQCFFPFVSFVFWLSLFHSVVAHFASSLQPLCHEDERAALLQFKKHTALLQFNDNLIIDDCDPSTYRKVALWNLEENSDCCSWDGIKCNAETGHVITLDVSSSCLHGSINSTSTLFHLVHLEWLNLAYNDFSYSEIPAAIKNLSKLSHLNLSSTGFTGQIPPELLELPNLMSLDLSYNRYYTVPDDTMFTLELRVPSLQNLVEKLNNLKVLNLDFVNISSPIPHILANLSSLTYLSLSFCSLRGEFPTKIFQLPNLSVLDVTFNRHLTGYLPEFGRSSPLTFLAIGTSNFSGTIPSSLGNLSKLVHLDISFNKFWGELPISSSWDNFTQLTYLDLSSSQISSSISWIAKNTKLTFLHLSDLNLLGEIPCWLMNLTQLTNLDMSLNQLTGPIPSCLMNLNQLSFLHLQSNQLTRHIPSEIRNLTQLVELDLSSNSFQGPLPNTFFELKNLGHLDLHSNNLSGIVELDMCLSQLKSLETLILSSNNISVVMSSIVDNAKFPKLRSLGLQSCNLSKFPNFLQDQDRLLVLDLSSNRITGLIPGWFSNVTMPNLVYLNLSHNLFTGFDQNLVFLPGYTLDLRFNKLEGLLPIPIELIILYLVSNNKLIGEISPLICKSKLLYALDLSNNNLSGKLPQCLANFNNALSLLALQNNKFHGSIPQTFMNGTNLRMIDVSNNLLQGRIPRSLINCTKLKYLHLGNNQITDIFPSWLGTLQELEVLILKSNRLHGAINELVKDFVFPKLRVIDASHNMFRGELPTKYLESWNAMKVVNMSHLTYMHDEKGVVYGQVSGYPNFEYAYSLTISNKGIELNYGKIPNMLNSIILSGNKFVGEIPACIASLRGLNNLNLSHNNLEGHIPSSLGNLTVLESLDLSSNRLSGKIPQQLVEITSLEVFNVSYNRLTGPIPQGKQFSTFDNSSFDGNPQLCGKPLSKICETFEPTKKQDEDSETSFGFDWKIILIGYASGLIVGAVLGNEFQTRKHGWFLKILGMQRMKRRRHQN